MDNPLELAGAALTVAFSFASVLLLVYLYRKPIHLDQYKAIQPIDSDDSENDNQDENENTTASSSSCRLTNAATTHIIRFGLTVLQLGISVFSFVHFELEQAGRKAFPSLLIDSAPILAWAYAVILAFVLLCYPEIAYRFWVRLQLDIFYFLELALMSTQLYYSDSLSLSIPEWMLEHKLQYAAWLIMALLVWMSMLTRPYLPPGLIKKSRGSILTTNVSEGSASIYSLLTFAWVNPLVYFGYKKITQESDLPDLETQDMSSIISDKFTRTNKMSFTRRLFTVLRKDILIQLFWGVPYNALIIATPICLKNIVAYIECKDCGPPALKNYMWVFALFATVLIGSICRNACLHSGRRIALKSISACNSEIYKKSLCRKNIAASAENIEGEDGKSKKDSSVNISNLVAVDVRSMESTFSVLHEIYGTLIQAVLSSIELYHILGPAAVVGIIFLVITMPLPALVSSVIMRLFAGIMEAKDDRMDILTEMLSGIRAIKYFGWESKFVEKIMAARENELKNNKKMYTQLSFAGIAWSIFPFVNMIVLLVAYTVFYGNRITASTLFATLSLFEILSTSLSNIPWVFSKIAGSIVSLNRISSFLDEDEVDKDTTVTKIEAKVHNPSASATVVTLHPIIGFTNATYSWPSKKYRVNSAPMPINPAKKIGWLQKLKAKFTKAPITAEQSENSCSTASAEFGTHIERFQLSNITADFPVGELSLIVGPTGSGKSALLLALLGELERVKGHMYLPRLDYDKSKPSNRGSGIAYVAQTAWLQNGTIRDNILFGKAFDQDRYDRILESCALMSDINILEFGDLTKVGDQGITLSGGQKQRVSLARAIYSDASVLLLDDCLSAVDTHTGRRIFDTLCGPLLNGRTVLMATHQVQLTLRSARYVVVLDKGRIVGAGTPKDCIQYGWISHATLVPPTFEQNSEIDPTTGDRRVNSDAKDKKIEIQAKPADEETKAEGAVPLKVYKFFFFASGGWIAWCLLVAIYSFMQAAEVAEKSWLAHWTNMMAELTGSLVLEAITATSGSNAISRNKEFIPWNKSESIAATMTNFGRSTPESVNLGFYIGIYIFLGLIPMIIHTFFVFFAMTKVNINSSRAIHSQLLHRISRAKIRFFDTTPIGRIINRFSADMIVVDNELLQILMQLVCSVIMIIVAVLVITVNMPYFVIPATFILGIYIVIGVIYVPISRDLKRIDSVSRSPILSHFNETINGLSTIRAYGFEHRFQIKNLGNLDNSNRAYYWLGATSRWLAWRLDLTSGLVSFCTGLLILLNSGHIESGWAALSLHYSIMFSSSVAHMLRSYAQNEMNMNSLQRITEYMNIEEEAPAVIEGSRPPASWPYTGQIVIKNLTVRYASSTLDTLKNISLSISGGEKIGIVGRTGSGKSTLALSLLRILEPEWGTIMIDNIDITKIGLQDLRTKLTIIPQDPVLFQGTLRFNLDPFGDHEDIELWEALRRSHFIPKTRSSTVTPALTVDSISISNRQVLSSASDQDVQEDQEEETTDPFKITLDTEVQAGGSNFSQGQRQLIALARALVRRSKIIIMDEATASVDYETDLKIQATIREEMVDATIITIAHRIRTIADFDRVLVMNAGEVAEFDTPYALMRREGSLFRELCEQSTELDTLLAISEAADRNTRI
ncbi:hypothetical protein FBU30_004953 [Linnemannia zychae]|nr:hypothetical protein FBU30_004953 [Linnemannia zychae]